MSEPNSMDQEAGSTAETMVALDLTDQLTITNAAPVFVGKYSHIIKGRWNGLLVAVKVLRVVCDSLHAMQRKVTREREVWALMSHLNVVPLLGYTLAGESFGDFGALISPWYQYGDLERFLGTYGHSLDPKTRIDLFHGVTSGLSYLHSYSPVIVHGDIKPMNILIDDEGNAKICDFGLVRIILEEGHSGHTTTSEYTGTDRYLAYELVKYRDVDLLSAASDVWALGCIGLKLLFLQTPYGNHRSNHFGDILRDILNGVLPGSRPVVFNHHGNHLWGVLEACWQLDPASRPTALNVREYLETLQTRLKPSEIGEAVGSTDSMIFTEANHTGEDAQADEVHTTEPTPMSMPPGKHPAIAFHTAHFDAKLDARRAASVDIEHHISSSSDTQMLDPSPNLHQRYERMRVRVKNMESMSRVDMMDLMDAIEGSLSIFIPIARVRQDNTGQEILTFQCTICPEAMQSQAERQFHFYHHLDYEPYSCSKCHDRFANKQALKRHKSRAHLISPSSTARTVATQSREVI